MPIIKSGFRSREDKAELARFYNTAAWKRARAAVLARSGGLCEFCGEPPKDGRPLDVVHLAKSTLELIRTGNPLNPGDLAAGHRACHSGYSSGRVPRPR